MLFWQNLNGLGLLWLGVWGRQEAGITVVMTRNPPGKGLTCGDRLKKWGHEEESKEEVP